MCRIRIQKMMLSALGVCSLWGTRVCVKLRSTSPAFVQEDQLTFTRTCRTGSRLLHDVVGLLCTQVVDEKNTNLSREDGIGRGSIQCTTTAAVQRSGALHVGGSAPTKVDCSSRSSATCQSRSSNVGPPGFALHTNFVFSEAASCVFQAWREWAWGFYGRWSEALAMVAVWRRTQDLRKSSRSTLCFLRTWLRCCQSISETFDEHMNLAFVQRLQSSFPHESSS